MWGIRVGRGCVCGRDPSPLSVLGATMRLASVPIGPGNEAPLHVVPSALHFVRLAVGKRSVISLQGAAK